MEKIGTITNTLELLEKYDLQALKKYGQNFLCDQNVILHIVDTAKITKDTCVIEIGPGIGALTEHLAKRAGKCIAYEIDERFIPILEQLPIELHHADFLKVDLKELLTTIDYKDIVVVSNLPYYITTDLLTKIFLESNQINRVVCMMQREVALKLTDPKESSPLKRLMEYCGNVQYMFTVSKNVFIPAPNVDSAILKIDIHPTDVDLKGFYTFLGECYKQRRKTLNNNLKKYPKTIFGDIDPSKRAEQLSLKELLYLFERTQDNYEG